MFAKYTNESKSISDASFWENTKMVENDKEITICEYSSQLALKQK